MKLVNQQRIMLKNNSEINEKVIQDYIFENPSVLGLGELEPIVKEKTQPSGGRLDMLFRDDDNNRYEVELQLGATDPSHIIRTLEYWNTEKKRYPQYDHTAVIIAEDITTRFQNVISLFNNQIPLIALQINATKTGDGNIALAFIKVMDKVELGTDEEEYVVQTDRAYWEKLVGKNSMELTDALFECLGDKKEGYEKKYNKFYIGVTKGGIAKNFISFHPKKSFVLMKIKSNEIPEITEKLEENLEINYNKRESLYMLKFKKVSEFKDNEEYLLKLIDGAKERYSAD